MEYEYKGWGLLPSAGELARCTGEGLSPGRIVRENRGSYQIVSIGTGDNDVFFNAEVSGAFRYKAVVPADYPAVGDWVAFREEGGIVIIEWVFSRSSCFSRKSAGIKTEEQVIAANIDVICLVFAINGGRNFTTAGLERYMIAAWDSGALPVVVLNKADLCSETERESAVLRAGAAAPGAEIHLISAASGEGLENLAKGMRPGTTIALAGPSGVGKSTIINSLSGSVLQRTGAQRESDLRGRHTTSHRELFRLDSGLIMIDSPGMRELQLWTDLNSAEDAFSDIAELALDCRFRDCSHRGEPGCAVQTALASGELAYSRFEDYLDLRREIDYLQRRQKESPVGKEQKRWKDITKQIRKYYKEKY